LRSAASITDQSLNRTGIIKPHPLWNEHAGLTIFGHGRGSPLTDCDRCPDSVGAFYVFDAAVSQPGGKSAGPPIATLSSNSWPEFSCSKIHARIFADN
jgi:hypothetical protein